MSASTSPTRRRFLATGAIAAAGGGVVLGTSSLWPARFLRERIREIGRDIPPAPHKPTPEAWSDNAVTLAWLGHATTLINFYGVRVLTDPTLFPRIGVDTPLGTFGPLRLVHCALTAAELPDVDLVLVSHAHFDHLDIASLAAVPGRPSAVMAAATSDLLPRHNYSSVRELRWNESVRVTTPRGVVMVRAIEVKHWGARLRSDTYRGYTGFIVEREGRKLLLGGDTAATNVFRDHVRYGPFDAAVMPVGAYNPWIRNHCTPEQAVALANDAGARLFVPVHHKSFRLSNEPFDEPLERTQAALAKEADRLAIRDIGETLVIRS
ncbi:MAG TPA: MBL fold metallo-hydrolase [Steroidobacteraceae bacterium]|nr:MBL fold metallo-hydrolase [Steroidobacteraceae bacterium]